MCSEQVSIAGVRSLNVPSVPSLKNVAYRYSPPKFWDKYCGKKICGKIKYQHSLRACDYAEQSEKRRPINVLAMLRVSLQKM